MMVKRKKNHALTGNKLWSVIILTNLFQLTMLRKIPSNEKGKERKDAGTEHILVLSAYKFVIPA
jgi:hypothetical protein